MTTTPPIAQWLQQSRKARDLTQKTLAEQLGYSVRLIEKIERGERRPSRHLADALALFFEVPPEERTMFVQFARLDPALPQEAQPQPAAPSQPWVTATPHIAGLPAQHSSFIGRRDDVQAIVALLRRPEVRLLTLTGPPGIGKTRLALRVAEESLADYRDGIAIVTLAHVEDPAMVVATVAQCLDVRDVEARPLLDVLKEYLQSKRLLLLLDNFEHLLGADAVPAGLIESCPHLKLLVTSREALHLSMEHKFHVSPLALPDMGQLPPPDELSEYEAVRLFLERAQSVRRDFAVTAENAPVIAEICNQLEGVPLSIELAAARTKVLSPESMRDRLGSRLYLLTGGARDLPARHQTLRNAIEWSYNLLSRDERLVFESLAVFVDGFTLEAAEAVCIVRSAEREARNEEAVEESASGPKPGENGREAGVGGHSGHQPLTSARRARPSPPSFGVVDALGSLVDKSLLFEEVAPGGLGHFRMLETIREYAEERLAESERAWAVHRQHMEFFLKLAEAAEISFRQSRQVGWLTQLEGEHGNLRAALYWAIEESGESSTGLRLAGALWQFWARRGYWSEGQEWLGKALAQAEGVAPGGARAKAIYGSGFIAFLQTDMEFARSQTLECLAMFREMRDGRAVANALNLLGLIEAAEGNEVEAHSLHEEALALSAETGNLPSRVFSLYGLAVLALDREDYGTAQRLGNEGLAIGRKIVDGLSIAFCLRALVCATLYCGDLELARSLGRQGLRAFEDLGDKRGVALLVQSLGHIELKAGNLRQAADLFERSMTAFQDLGYKHHIPLGLAGLAAVALAEGQLERAISLLNTGERALQDANASAMILNRIRREVNMLAPREGLGRLGGDAWAPGEEYQVMGLDEAIEYALDRGR